MERCSWALVSADIARTMARAADDCYEAVRASGELYSVPKGLARAFARSVGIKDHHNFPRAMDRNDEVHTVVEDWQPLYNVCWLETVDTSGTAIDWI